MRGTKLQAWQFPPLWKALQENNLSVPENSFVPPKQTAMFSAVTAVLSEMAKDVREGLLETVGVESEFSDADGRTSMILKLASGTDAEKVAQAIALENADAWCDNQGRVHLGINPWFSTKDVDQTVLCAIKVIHVMLGLHAVCELPPKTFGQKFLSSVMEIMRAQQKAAQGKR